MSRVIKAKLGLTLLVAGFLVVLSAGTVRGEACCYGTSGTDTPCASLLTYQDCVDSGCNWNDLCDPHTSLNQLLNFIEVFIQWIPFFAGIAGFAFLLIGGFNYITSGDDPEQAEKARLTVTYAVVGIALSLLLFIVTRLMVNVIPRLGDFFNLSG